MKYYEEPEECFVCSIQGQLAHHHLIGGPYRSKSEQYGLVIPVCPVCHRFIHSDASLMRLLRQHAQRQMMDNEGWTLERWLKEFGKNYLEEVETDAE